MLERFDHDLSRLDKPLAGLVHRDAKPVVLQLGRAPPKPDEQPPAGEDVEHGDLLGHPHRIMPRQNNDSRAQLNPGGAPGHIGQKLHHIGDHGVVIEMMLHRPQGVEPQRLG